MEAEEEIDDELTDAELYMESMIEIEENEGKPGGHDEDPFDRTGEYDEDLDLNAPVAPTPDIPQFVEPQRTGDVDMRKLREDIEKAGIFNAFQARFPSSKFSCWREYQKSRSAHLLPLIQDYLEAQSVSEPCTIENSRKFEDFWTSLRASPRKIFKVLKTNPRLILSTLELDLLAAEMTRKIEPIFGAFEEEFVVELEDMEDVTRIYGVLIESKIWMKNFTSATKILAQFETLMRSKGLNGQTEIESLLPIEEFWRNHQKTS